MIHVCTERLRKSFSNQSWSNRININISFLLVVRGAAFGSTNSLIYAAISAETVMSSIEPWKPFSNFIASTWKTSKSGVIHVVINVIQLLELESLSRFAQRDLRKSFNNQSWSNRININISFLLVVCGVKFRSSIFLIYASFIAETVMPSIASWKLVSNCIVSTWKISKS